LRRLLRPRRRGHKLGLGPEWEGTRSGGCDGSNRPDQARGGFSVVIEGTGGDVSIGENAATGTSGIGAADRFVGSSFGCVVEQIEFVRDTLASPRNRLCHKLIDQLVQTGLTAEMF
jgi:hypothetical protein